MDGPPPRSSSWRRLRHEHLRRQEREAVHLRDHRHEGTFHTLRNRDYGTNVVAGVTPGKGGQDVEGIPVFNTFHAAVEEAGANTAMILVPPRFAADSILEAEDAGIELIIAITEGIPAHDELRVYNTIKKNRRARLVGPNCPGSCRPARRTSGSSRRRSSSPATSASSRARARSPTRSATSWRRAASGTRRSSGSAATRFPAPTSSTRSAPSRPTRRPN